MMYIFLYLFIFADPVVAVSASLRAQASGTSGSAVANGIVSPANAEDQEEDDLLDSDVDHSAPSAGFLPPLAEVQKAASAEPQQMLTEAKPQPEALFHFTPPRQRPMLLSAAAAAAHHPISMPSAAAVKAFGISKAMDSALPSKAFDGVKLPPLSSQSAVPVPKGNHTGRVPMGLLSTQSNSEESKPKIPWPPSEEQYIICDPPCIQGRGVCNDNVCFCRSPYIGSTCQHKIEGFYRAPRIMVIGFSAVCLIFGILFAKVVFYKFQGAVETRLERYGQGKQRFETWAPPGKGDRAPA